MKFAKELERDAVPEWRIKYLNYKAGKKYIKALCRAINRTPSSAASRTPSLFPPPLADRTWRETCSSTSAAAAAAGPAPSPSPLASPSHAVSPARAAVARQSLAGDANANASRDGGSFVPMFARDDGHIDFELPAPAMRAPPDSPALSRPAVVMRRSLGRPGTHRAAAGPTVSESPSHLRRILTHASGQLTRDHSRPDARVHQLDLVRERERDFFDFMDSELEKVEAFYKLKEEQAGQRLAALREQLHEMRNRRIHEMAHAHQQSDSRSSQNASTDNGIEGWVQPIKAKMFPPGPNSKALRSMPRTPYLPPSSSNDTRRDYSRRPENHDVSYRTAKRKLKLALQEFYRGLELLKSYALLNRTAFRKLNKKFDKAASARPPLRYMSDKVNRACFVSSDVLDGHIMAVEDLYARYFERGNHKLAVGKLRSLARKSSDESGSCFLNGFLIGTGVVFTIQGLIYGSQLLFDQDAQLRVRTSFLMQIYAGYFLMLLMFSLFCIDCFLWARSKVNYPFIFEFDRRSHIDWRRMAEFPSFFLLLLGVCMWSNFNSYGAQWMYLYYPVVLISITVVVIFFPAPVLGHKSRRWFVYAHWRLLLAGIYPVEFRDFFLGDMYCSLTYSLANIELFFCLYARKWEGPDQCNSSHSWLMGFFMTLPPIWRFFQCLRRYRDTRNVFPHLVNGGKYTMTIVSSVVLSLYRINNSRTNLALYITFALINSIYVSIWDLFMDFSLLQANSRHFFLRDILAFKRRWPYYSIMVVDPVLRFAWILYAIFAHDTQHSTIVSFLVSLMEIVRRGMWALFRVENEHCANVAQYKASRDVPLPYRIEPLMDRASAELSPMMPTEEEAERLRRRRHEATLTGASSTAVASTLGTLKRRADTSSARTFSKMLAEAHKQDFEKRRKPPADTAAGLQDAGLAEGQGGPSDDEEDDYDDYDDDDDEYDDDEDGQGV